MKIKNVNLIILLATLVGTLICLSFMPDIVPVHFDIHGVADRWGSKYENLIMSGCMVAMIALWFGVDAGYRKTIKQSDDEKAVAEAMSNIKVLNITFTAVTIMFAFLNFAILYMSCSQIEGFVGQEIDIMKIVTILLGASFIIIGNIIPKARNNSTVGFRLPWTRFNDATWQKCNRIAGIVMVVIGILSIVAGLIFDGMLSIMVMLFISFIAITVLTIYAYEIYRKEKANEKES
jgi:uncharacterized membrane protein